jgi:YfiH family protein
MTAQPPPAESGHGWIVPQWPAPDSVRALITTRSGGYSQGPWGGGGGAGGMNLGVGSASGGPADDPSTVQRNREHLRGFLPQAPLWLHQVHGTAVLDADHRGPAPAPVPPEADAAFTVRPGVVCTVLVADCLPVLLTDVGGRGVAAAHAGWRGMAGGVIQNAVARFREAIGDPRARILAYLGPAIGPGHFEVGPDVLAAMRVRLPDAPAAFVADAHGKYRADLFALARQALAQVDVVEVYGGGLCTASDPERFYSFRRDRVTGRHAALIWRQR